MGFFVKFLIGMSLGTVLLAYYLYEPLPADFTDHRLDMQFGLSVYKLVKLVSSVGNFLGFGMEIKLRKDIIESLVGRVQKLRPQDKTVSIQQMSFDGVYVRIYTPPTAKKNGPGFVYYHGGGYALFRIDHFDELCMRMAKISNAVVVSVDYRTSPEFVYPTSIDDGFKATKYFLQHAAEFNVDPTRVAIGGDSAGGNMAAVLALKLRDARFKPMPKLQVLIYPHTQSVDYQTPSYQVNYIILTRSDMLKFFMSYVNASDDSLDLIEKGLHISSKTREKYDKYLSHELIPKKYIPKEYKKPTYPKNHVTFSHKLEKAATSPYKSPLLANYLRGIPEVYIFTCEHDVLRDDGLLYVERLKKEGVAYTHVHCMECFHGVFTFEVDKYVKESMEFVKEKL